MQDSEGCYENSVGQYNEIECDKAMVKDKNLGQDRPGSRFLLKELLVIWV